MIWYGYVSLSSDILFVNNVKLITCLAKHWLAEVHFCMNLILMEEKWIYFRRPLLVISQFNSSLRTFKHWSFSEIIIINYPLIRIPINLLIRDHVCYNSSSRISVPGSICCSIFLLVCEAHINYKRNSINMIDTTGVCQRNPAPAAEFHFRIQRERAIFNNQYVAILS